MYWVFRSFSGFFFSRLRVLRIFVILLHWDAILKYTVFTMFTQLRLVPVLHLSINQSLFTQLTLAESVVWYIQDEIQQM